MKRGATVSCVQSNDQGVYDVSKMKIKAPLNQKTMECPVCQSEVSVDAYKCPNCGHPFKDEPHGVGFWGVVGAILVVVLALLFF